MTLRIPGARLTWLCSSLLAGSLGLAACGSSSHRLVVDDSRAYWTGPPGEFCSNPRHVKATGGALGARLVLGSKSVLPGGTLRARVENEGEEELVHGVGPFLADRKVGGRWVPRGLEEGVGPVAVPLPALRVAPGTAGPCIDVLDSTHWRPGSYRVRFKVNSAEDPADPPEVVVYGYFRVTGAGPS